MLFTTDVGWGHHLNKSLHVPVVLDWFLCLLSLMGCPLRCTTFLGLHILHVNLYCWVQNIHFPFRAFIRMVVLLFHFDILNGILNYFLLLSFFFFLFLNSYLFHLQLRRCWNLSIRFFFFLVTFFAKLVLRQMIHKLNFHCFSGTLDHCECLIGLLHALRHSLLEVRLDPV